MFEAHGGGGNVTTKKITRKLPSAKTVRCFPCSITRNDFPHRYRAYSRNISSICPHETINRNGWYHAIRSHPL